MKQKTKDMAIKWLETAKGKDTFSIDTVPHSKKEIEELLGMNSKDIEDKDHGDMGKESDEGHSQEFGDGTSKGSA